MNLSKGFILTFLSTLSWAVGIIIVRYLLKNGGNAFNIAFLSVLFVTPYWLFIFIKNFPKIKLLSGNEWRPLILLGIISSFLINFIEIFALKYSPAINFSFLNRTVIVFTIIAAFIFLKEQINLKKIILTILILSGSYLLITKGQNLTITLGDIFTITEAMLIALSAVLVKITVVKVGPDISNSISFLIGVMPAIIIAFFMKVIYLPNNIVLLFISAILYNILLNYFRFRALKISSATYVTMIFSFTPVLVVLMAIPILGESLLPIQFIGGALIVLAGIFVEKLKI